MQTRWWAATALALLGLVAALVMLGVNQHSSLSRPVTAAAGAVPSPPELGVPDNSEPLPSTILRIPEASPWVPGVSITMTDREPVPGESIRVSRCTVAYSFTTPTTAYAVTAAHCGGPGDLVWAVTGDGEPDFSAPVGTFTYSDLYDPGTSLLDVGVIEITDPARVLNAPDLPAETVLIDRLDLPPEQVCKFGTTTGHTCGEILLLHSRERLVDNNGRELPAVSSTARVCARAGDSGGPVYMDLGHSNVIVGVVSGTRDGSPGSGCGDLEAEGMTMSYTPMTRIQDVVDRVIPDGLYRLEVLP